MGIISTIRNHILASKRNKVARIIGEELLDSFSKILIFTIIAKSCNNTWAMDMGHALTEHVCDKIRLRCGSRLKGSDVMAFLRISVGIAESEVENLISIVGHDYALEAAWKSVSHLAFDMTCQYY